MGKGDYLGEFEQVVLLALARLREGAYGVAIAEEILKTTGRDVTIPSVYVTLGRLEEKGLVRSSTGQPSPTRGGRAKRYYHLEPAAVAALQQSRAMWDQLWQGVDLEETVP